MIKSFSSDVKQQLGLEHATKKCCRFTEEKLLSLDKTADNSAVLGEIWMKCRCDGCRTVFVRRAFIFYGSVTDPDKSYHLDFSVKNAGEADVIEVALAETGFVFHRTMRRGRHVLYIKNSTAIEDFLVYIGASGAAFGLMNSKIVHEFRNSVNRQVNCDTANIEKQLGSAKKYLEAIHFLISNGKIDVLPRELKEAAELRLQNDQASLADLANMSDPPVTKSGMRHRLDKILDFAIRFGMNKK